MGPRLLTLAADVIVTSACVTPAVLASDVWVPCDVSMTSASDVWVQSVRVTNMWGPVNGQHMLGPNWALVGLGWSGLGRADPDTWHAATLPRRSRGLLLGCGLRLWA